MATELVVTKGFAADSIAYLERHRLAYEDLAGQLDMVAKGSTPLVPLNDDVYALRLSSLTTTLGGEEWLLSIEFDNIDLQQIVCVAILQCSEAEARNEVMSVNCMRRVNMAIRDIIIELRLVTEP